MCWNWFSRAMNTPLDTQLDPMYSKCNTFFKYYRNDNQLFAKIQKPKKSLLSKWNASIYHAYSSWTLNFLLSCGVPQQITWTCSVSGHDCGFPPWQSGSSCVRCTAGKDFYGKLLYAVHYSQAYIKKGSIPIQVLLVPSAYTTFCDKTSKTYPSKDKNVRSVQLSA